MDRNRVRITTITICTAVALRKESVDRNDIETSRVCTDIVALRKESVDRNYRRFRAIHNAKVALRKESVDRNLASLSAVLTELCRSPQGERG